MAGGSCRGDARTAGVQGRSGDAAFLLGRLHEEGVGVTADSNSGLRWIEKAAVRKHAGAQNRMGRAYYRGEGRPINANTGVRWFKRGAMTGSAEAQYNLAIAYHLGRGINRNEVEAVRWFEIAAEQNHVDAQYLAGDAYSDGWGTEKDLAWAARWYGRAAAQGLARAQYKLGLFHFGGLGVPKDPIEAYKWISLATEGNFTNESRLESFLTQNMSPIQIQEAIRRSQAWRPTAPSREVHNSYLVRDPPSILFAQYALSTIGYFAGPIDGHFGAQSRGALIAYQNINNLTADGKLTLTLLRGLKALRLAHSRK